MPESRTRGGTYQERVGTSYDRKPEAHFFFDDFNSCFFAWFDISDGRILERHQN